MRVTRKGQVTIPIEIRRQFGIDETTEVEFEVVDGVIRLGLVSNGRRVVERLVSAGYAGPTTEALLALTRGRV